MPGSFVPITQPETIIIIGTAAAPAAAVEKATGIREAMEARDMSRDRGGGDFYSACLRL